MHACLGILRIGSRKIFTPQQRRVGFRGFSCVSIVTSDYAWKARAIRGRFVRHLESLEADLNMFRHRSQLASFVLLVFDNQLEGF